MTDVEITIKLPEALVEDAARAGIAIEQRADIFIQAVSEAIRRQRARAELRAIGEKLQDLPDAMKPTQAEIDEAIEDYWSKKCD
jgi:hypothetical protein